MSSTRNFMAIHTDGIDVFVFIRKGLPSLELTRAELYAAFAFSLQRRVNIVDVQPKEVANHVKHV